MPPRYFCRHFSNYFFKNSNPSPQGHRRTKADLLPQGKRCPWTVPGRHSSRRLARSKAGSTSAVRAVVMPQCARACGAAPGPLPSALCGQGWRVFRPRPAREGVGPSRHWLLFV